MKKIWDLERLVNDADSFRIVDSLGIEKRRSGATTYVRCPSGSHSETRINHAKLFKNGCKCFSCGECYSSYGMAKAYMENILGMSASHDEICRILAESAGADESEYIIRGGNEEQRKPFPLTKEELELIGLEPKPASRVIVGYSTRKDENHRERYEDGGYIRTEPITGMSIYALFRDNEDLFWEIVQGKVEVAYRKTTKWATDTILELPLKDIKEDPDGLLRPGFRRYARVKKLRESLPGKISASKNWKRRKAA